MIKPGIVKELEGLVANLLRLTDAEDAALQAFPDALPEIRSILEEIVEEIIQKASTALGKHPGMRGGLQKTPLEIYERYFYTLRLAAEAEWVRSQKLKGKGARKARKNADRLAVLTTEAANALMVVAKARNQWSVEYVQEHGLEPWVS